MLMRLLMSSQTGKDDMTKKNSRILSNQSNGEIFIFNPVLSAVLFKHWTDLEKKA